MTDAMKKNSAKLFSAEATKSARPSAFVMFLLTDSTPVKEPSQLVLLTKKVSFMEMSNPTSSYGSSQLLLSIHFAVLENYKKMLSICVAGPKALGTLTV